MTASIRIISDHEALRGSSTVEPRIAAEAASTVVDQFAPGTELTNALHLAHTDRLGIAAQVGGSSIQASVITRDITQNKYVQKDFRITNEHGRGVHVLLDLFATLAKVSTNVVDVVANISWAGSHRGDLGEIGGEGQWNHSNFDVERFQDTKTRYPIPIADLLLHKLATKTGREGEVYDHTLIVKNGMCARKAMNRGSNGRKFNLNIFHDPHASILHGARNNSGLKDGDNYGVLIGGTGNNIWLGENWNSETKEFAKYHQTRFGRRPNMFTLESQVDDIKALEPFRFDAWLKKMREIFIASKSVSPKDVSEQYDFYGRPELWFTGGRNDDANSGIKATFNYIRNLIRVAKGNIASHDLSAQEAQQRLKLAFDKLEIPEQEREALIQDPFTDPVLKDELNENSWVKTIVTNKDHVLVKAIMSNLLNRFTEVIGAVLKEYNNVILNLKGFVVHGGFIRSLLTDQGHSLHTSFVEGLNKALSLTGKMKLEESDVQVHDPYLDGVYQFTLDDLAKQDA